MKIRFLFLFILLLTSRSLSAQNKGVVDSLKQLLEKETVDSVRIQILTELAYEELYNKPQKAIEYCQEIQQICQKKGSKKYECFIVNLMGGAYWVKGDLDKALTCFQNSLALSYEIKDAIMQAKNTGNIGLIYSGAGNKELAKINYAKALKMYEQLNDTSKIASSLSNIGVIHLELGAYDSALFYFQKANPLYEKKRSNDLQTLYINLSDLAFRQQNFEKAEFWARKCLKYAEKEEDIQTLSYAYFFMADIDLSRKKLDSAYFKAQKAVKLAEECQSKETISKAYKVFSKVLYGKGNYKDSYKYYDLYVVYRDSVESESTKNALQLFEHERKNGEVAMLKAEQLEKEIRYQEENTQKNNLILLALSGIVLLASITFFIFRGRIKIAKAYAQLSLANEDILQKNEEIHQQKEEILQTLQTVNEQNGIIEKKNHDMTASIVYARRIQSALLPKKQNIHQYIPDLLLFYQPKDIVSGDFYWFATFSDQLNNNQLSRNSEKWLTDNLVTEHCILAVADCTGHGVPGAFMTVIGNNLLDQVINKDKVFSPAQILSELDKLLLKTLKQNSETQIINDGMDISILKLEKKVSLVSAEKGTFEKLVWASAKRPLWIFEGDKGEITEYKGNRFPIGSSQFEEKIFIEQEIILQKGDLIYSFTDGYADQFGEKGKFTIRKFRNLLTDIHTKPFKEQEQILDKNLQVWKGSEKQTDDVLIVGLRIF